MGFLKDKKVIGIIIVGLIIRLLAGFTPGFKFDVDTWFNWANRLNEVGFANFYSPKIWTNYTPGYLYLLALLGYIKNILLLNNNFFYYILKLPAIISEIILGLLIYQEISKLYNQRLAYFSLALILLNPALIFNSAVWGQIDGIITLFLFLSISFLRNNLLTLSSICFGLAFLVKPQAIALAPIFVLYMIKFQSIRNIVQLTLPALLLILILSIPFFPKQPILGFPKLIFQMINDYPYNSLNAYNLWGISGFWVNDSQKMGEFTLHQLGNILFFFYWIILAYFYIRNKISLYSLATLALLAFYFLPTRVHERYLYPAIPFLIIVGTILKSKITILLSVVLTFLHLINLYFVYIYYNVLYLKIPTIWYWPTLFSFIEKYNKDWSIISTTIFLIISFWLIKLNYARKNP